MTELEQRLTTALSALSEQYEREMKHQAALVETLLRRIERFEGRTEDLRYQIEQLGEQVNFLAGDYRELVRVLNGP